MTTVEQAFKNRWNEVNGLYYGLFQRKSDIVKEIKTLSSQIKSKEADDIINNLLSNEDQNENHEIKSKIDNLQKEYETIEKKIAAIHSRGGLEHLYHTDNQLKELIQPLQEELKEQAKKEEKQRTSLEKRYEKVMDEILKLDEEKQELVRLIDSRKQLLNKINRTTNDSAFSLSMLPHYEMKKLHFYNHIAKIKHFS